MSTPTASPVASAVDASSSSSPLSSMSASSSSRCSPRTDHEQPAASSSESASTSASPAAFASPAATTRYGISSPSGMAASPSKPKSGATACAEEAAAADTLSAFQHMDDDTGQGGSDGLKKPSALSAPPIVFVPAASPSVASKPSSLASSSLSFAAQHALATSSSLPGASYALTVMTLLNLLNYCDRFVPSACKGLIQADLGLSDVQTALPMGAFLLVYMLTSPVFGYLADQGHVRRTSLIGAGVFLWSLATTAGAFATDFTTFLLARAAVGVGEAAYATIAPALLCDFFPVHMRPKILSFFYLAMPVGAALGYAVAGEVGEAHGWRTSFLVCGIPGMVLVVLVLGMTEPPRGQQDAAAVEQALAAGHAAPVVAPSSSAAVAGADANAGAGAPGSSGSEAGEASDDADVGWPEALQSLLGNAHYMAALGAVTLVSFASGGIADWLPTWLVRVQGIDVGTAGTLVGAITCVAGVGGSLSGYVIGESLAERGVSNAYFVVGAVSQGVTCLFSAGLLLAGKYASLPETVLLIFVCQFCMWLNVGGCSAVIANSVHVKIRSRAFGLSILISHLGGDAISPSLIGAISDESGGNLSMGFSVVPVAFGLAAVVFAIAARRLHDPHAEAIRLLPPPVGSARGGKGFSSSSSSDDIELTLAESPRSASASAAAAANNAAAEDEFESIEPDLLEAEV